MVACHRKLRVLILDEEVVQLFLLRELIAESDAVVIDTKTDDHLTDLTIQGQSFFFAFALIFRLLDGLVQGHCKFVVVVTDVLGLTPYGLPGLVKLLGLFLDNLEAVHQVGLVQTFRGVLVLRQFESEERRPYHFTTLIGHLIERASRVIHRKLQFDVAVWRLHAAC